MKMTIKKKIILGFSSVILLLCILAGMSYFQLTNVNKTYDNLINVTSKKVNLANQLETLFYKQSSSIRGYLLTGSPTYYNQYQVANDHYQDTMKKLGVLEKNSVAKRLYSTIDETDDKYYAAIEHQVQLKNDNKQDELTEYTNNTVKDLTLTFQQSIEALTKLHEDELVKVNKNTNETVNKTQQLLIIITVVTFIISIIIAIFIGRIISNPIKKVSNVMKQVAKGDLSVEPLKVKNRDEIGELADSFNKMVQDLSSVVRQVSDSSLQVASSSEQLTASAQQSTSAAEQVTRVITENSEGTERQLQTFVEVSASVSEMAQGMDQIADASEDMLRTSEETRTLAGHGANTIANMVTQMNEIHVSVEEATGIIHTLGQRSDEIRRITDIITGIAEQTNLLALNAAIEAARAGEQGKGFAVVADEVRKLAEESSKSSEQISKMITVIQDETKKAVLSMESGNEKVETGLSYTTEANESFTKIAKSIDSVTGKVADVSSSVEEIQAITSQIVTAIQHAKEVSEQVAAGSQENAAASEEQLATMEEITSSAESLSHLADELQVVISKFKLS
ncbi:methyl-accepting chemotaxis protein [Bacillus sp. FJAT-49736]|uniref:methyl-accepting chemotaxis protein n=1 Tax=Bacillus sp. FJAT-49736 TaxID=2833582 RepID=UPI001BC8D207|nr:methyl-accepting chemotaxis protein [Bacillus sp. FJAT-49736]MBS4174096.1 methyl-accepting chemotaxis protein [Bacillus sp. FJAT-49736]